MVDFAKGPAEVLGPLKAILVSISAAYAKHQVCSNTLLKALPLRLCPQDVIAFKDKVKILHSRIAVLEELFEQPACDEKETTYREELLQYVNGLYLDQMLMPFQ